MIGYDSDGNTLTRLGESAYQEYVGGLPFPHVVVDEFFDPKVLDAVLAEAKSVDKTRRYIKAVNRKTDHNKFAFMPDVVGPETARLINFFNSGVFISYLEKMTGIDGLIPDPSYMGGGLHLIENGGYLEIHADFNHLQKFNLERRINLLLYLNKDWQDNYDGNLELWDRATMTKVASVAPLFNRCVIFSTTKKALHGHPLPLNLPPGIARFSIALYYYTNTWQSSEQAHSTLYYISQDNKVKLQFGRLLSGFLKDLVPPIFRKMVRALKRDKLREILR